MKNTNLPEKEGNLKNLLPEKLGEIKPFSQMDKRLDKYADVKQEARKIPTKTVYRFSNLEWQAKSKGSDYQMYGQLCLYAIDGRGNILDKVNFFSLLESDAVDLLRYSERLKKFPNEAKISIPTSKENEIKIYVVFGINENDRELGAKYYSTYNDQCSDERRPFYEGGSDDFYVIDKPKVLTINGGWFSIVSNGKKRQEIIIDANAELKNEVNNYRTVYMNLHHDNDREYQVNIRFRVSKEVKHRFLPD